jgi:sulfate permease, SulP family
MSAGGAIGTKPPDPSFGDLFTPKLVTVLREGYRLSHLRADAYRRADRRHRRAAAVHGDRHRLGRHARAGLYTAIVGGFFVSLLGGSRFQIGGPAGAFIVLVAATVMAHGMDGLILATMLSGLMLAAVGFLRLGTYIKFIPYPVTVGFTAGIASSSSPARSATCSA